MAGPAPSLAPEPPNRFHRGVELSKDVFSLGKNLVILAIILVFFFKTGFLRNRLVELGVSEINLGIFKAQVQANDSTKSAATVVEGIKARLADLQLKLDEIEKRNPSVGREVGPLRTEITTLQAQAGSADESFKTKLVAQQAVIQQINPQSVADEGWIYVGQVDESRKAWAGIGAKNISPTTDPEFKPGQTLRITASPYLYGNVSGKWHNEGNVLAVLPEGSQVQIIGVDYSHAKAGGWFVWLKVRRTGV